jgi:hypothetical protein
LRAGGIARGLLGRGRDAALDNDASVVVSTTTKS